MVDYRWIEAIMIYEEDHILDWVRTEIPYLNNSFCLLRCFSRFLNWNETQGVWIRSKIKNNRFVRQSIWLTLCTYYIYTVFGLVCIYMLNILGLSRMCRSFVYMNDLKVFILYLFGYKFCYSHWHNKWSLLYISLSSYTLKEKSL